MNTPTTEQSILDILEKLKQQEEKLKQQEEKIADLEYTVNQISAYCMNAGIL